MGGTTTTKALSGKRRAGKRPDGERTYETTADLASAWGRVGQTSDARARWLVHFAGRDLGDLKPQQWRRLGWEMSALLCGSAPLGRREWLSPVAERVIRNCHAWLRDGFQAMAEPTGVWSFEEKVRSLLFMRDGRLIGGKSPSAFLSDFAWFRLAVHETLTAARRRFRFCGNPSCRKPFIARKRQAYCAPKCSQVVRTRKFREKHPEKVREWRRLFYARKLHRPSRPKKTPPPRAARQVRTDRLQKRKT